jgi:hypothetical protein
MKTPTLDQLKINALTLGKLIANFVQDLERYENAAPRTKNAKRKHEEDIADLEARLLSGKLKKK